MKWINRLSPQWQIGIISPIIGFILTISWDYWKSKPILTTLWSILIAIYSLSLSILNFEIRVWWLLIGIFIIIGILYLINKLTTIKENEPDFIKYNEDTLKGLKWTWNWKFDVRTKKWSVSNLQNYCPQCNTMLIENSGLFDISYECPRCNFILNKYNNAPNKHQIEVLIHDNMLRHNL